MWNNKLDSNFSCIEICFKLIELYICITHMYAYTNFIYTIFYNNK